MDRRRNYRSSTSLVRESLRDLTISLENWRLPVHLAWRDLQNQYRRSLLGPLWLTMTVVIRITALGILFSTLFKQPIETYLVWLTTGLVAWDFISGSLQSSCEWFSQRSGYIKQGQTTLFSLVIWGMTSQILILLHNLPLCYLVCVLTKTELTWNALYLPIGVIMLCVVLTPLGVILGMTVPRLRDLGPLINSMLQVAFFLTPVMWMPGQKGIPEAIDKWNPFSHLVSWIRNPLLGEPIEGFDFLLFGISLFVLVPLACAVFVRFRRRLTFWL